VSEGLLLSDEEIAELTDAERAEYLTILEDERAATAHLAWRARARPQQLPPDGDWRILFLRGGRGSGKSWAAAHILVELIATDPLRETEGPGQWAIVAPTYASARDIGIESESGLLAALGTNPQEVAAGHSARVALWNRSLGEVRLRDGSVVFLDSADDGGVRIQGKNLRGAWVDEVGLWRQWERAFDESIAFALRKGNARLVVTGTPKRDQPARALVKRLLADETVVSRRLRTVDNAHNLSPAFFESVARYGGTVLGLQELEGELLEDLEGALFRREWLDRARRDPGFEPVGGYQRAVVGLDPADPGQGSEQGLAVVALGNLDRELYVLASEGHRLSLGELLGRTLDLAREHQAIVVVERNHGGRALLDLLEREMASRGVRVPYREVWASAGKVARAEGPALLAEQGKLHMVGHHVELEEELCTFTGGSGERFDRGDAFVWACAELAGQVTGPLADPGAGRAVPWRGGPARLDGGAVGWEGNDDLDRWAPAGYPDEREIVIPIEALPDSGGDW